MTLAESSIRFDAAVSFGIAVPTTFRRGMQDLFSLHSVAELQRLARDIFRLKTTSEKHKVGLIEESGSIGGISGKEFPAAGLRSSLLGRRRPAVPPPRHASSGTALTIAPRMDADEQKMQGRTIDESRRNWRGYRTQPATAPFRPSAPSGSSQAGESIHENGPPPMVAHTQGPVGNSPW